MDFLLGILVGLIVSFFYWQSVILKAINDGIDEAFAAELEPKKLVVTVEQEGDQFFLYQTDNNRFLMQGTSLADFQKRLPSLNIDVLYRKQRQHGRAGIVKDHADQQGIS